MEKYVLDHPGVINIETTRRCNIRCKMCARADRPADAFRHTDMDLELPQEPV